MNVAVRDMIALTPLWRRSGRRVVRAGTRRKPAAPVTRSWEGVTALLRGALIMAIGLVLAGMLGWGWSTITDPKVLPIKSVQVRGVFTHVEAPVIRAAVAPYLSGNFMTVDVHRVQQAVLALPWVRRADVRRVWPDAVQIAVVEQVPVALWGGDALVNDAGAVFKPDRASYPSGLPSLQGPEGSGEVVVTALRNMEAIMAPLGLHITHLILDERRAWSMELDNGIQVVLGRGDGYGRLLKFVRFYHRAFHDRETAVARVDLRYSNGFAVLWKDESKQGVHAK